MKISPLILTGGIGLFILAAVAAASEKKPSKSVPKTPKNPASSAFPGWTPYEPTPPEVAARARELLPVMTLDTKIVEADPSGENPFVMYHCGTHPPSHENPKPHKGVDAWKPALTKL